MNKRDRVAVTVSVIGMIASIVWAVLDGPAIIVPPIWLLLISAYWGVRFIKNDISFISVNDK